MTWLEIILYIVASMQLEMVKFFVSPTSRFYTKLFFRQTWIPNSIRCVDQNVKRKYGQYHANVNKNVDTKMCAHLYTVTYTHRDMRQCVNNILGNCLEFNTSCYRRQKQSTKYLILHYNNEQCNYDPLSIQVKEIEKLKTNLFFLYDIKFTRKISRCLLFGCRFYQM